MSGRETAAESPGRAAVQSTLVLRAYGRTIAFDGPAPAITMAKQLLPSGYKAGSGTAELRCAVREMADGRWAVEARDRVLSIRENLVDATEYALSDLELWVAEHARNRIFVHAGCVAVDGRAIVLPGRSRSGKSGLTAALVRAGAQYYSDEYAVLDSQGLVRPYPRMLVIRPYDGGPARRVPVDELGGKTGRGPAAVNLVAVLRHDPVARWRAEPMTRGPAILRILDNTVAARSRPLAALTALESATQDVYVIEGTRGDADEAAARLLSMLTNVS